MFLVCLSLESTAAGFAGEVSHKASCSDLGSCLMSIESTALYSSMKKCCEEAEVLVVVYIARAKQGRRGSKSIAGSTTTHLLIAELAW